MAASADSVALPPSIAAARRYRRWLIRGAVVLFLGGGFALWAWGERNEARMLHDMPPAERSALYDEARRYADLLCKQAESEDALRSRCADTAEFMLAFPECDEACRKDMRVHMRGPAR